MEISWPANEDISSGDLSAQMFSIMRNILLWICKIPIFATKADDLRRPCSHALSFAGIFSSPMPTLQCVIRFRLLHSPGGYRTVGKVWDMSSFIEWCCRLEDWLIQIYIYIWGTPHLHWIIGRPQCIIEPFFKGQWQFSCTTLLAGNVSKCASWLWNSPDKMLGGGPAETRLWGVIQGSVLNLFICMSSHPG